MRSVSTIVAACFLGFLVNGHANETTARDDATDQATKQEMCKLTICQYNLRVTLKQKNGSLYDKTFDVLPGVVQPFGLTIFAGQTVLQVVLGNARFVESNGNRKICD
jgi:hypothetical protein